MPRRRDTSQKSTDVTKNKCSWFCRRKRPNETNHEQNSEFLNVQRNDHNRLDFGRETCLSKGEGDLGSHPHSGSLNSVQTSQWLESGSSRACVDHNVLLEDDFPWYDTNISEEHRIRLLRLRELRLKLAQMQQSNTDLSRFIERTKHESESLQFQLETQESKNKQLTEENTECMVRVVENECLEKSVKKLREQLDCLSNELEQSRTERRQLRCECVHLEIERQRLIDETLRLESERLTQQTKLEAMKLQCERLELTQDELIHQQEFLGRWKELFSAVKVYLRVKRGNTTADQKFGIPYKNGCLNIRSEEIVRLVSRKKNDPSHDDARAFPFNRIFLPGTSQTEIYKTLSAQCQRILDGSHVAIIFHGTSNSGKSFSCYGNPKKPGIASLAVTELFEILRQKGVEGSSLYVSIIEIYNDHLTCLLSKQTVRLIDTGTVVHVYGQKEELITCPDDFDNLLSVACAERKSIELKGRQFTSRSHMFIVVKYVPETSTNDVKKKLGTLILGDLASVRNLKPCGLVDRDRLLKQESWYIQRSLIVLSSAIHHLRRNDCVNHCRGTRLTELLKPCFAGSCYFILFLTVTDDTSNMQATQHILELGRAAMTAISACRPG